MNRGNSNKSSASYSKKNVPNGSNDITERSKGKIGGTPAGIQLWAELAYLSSLVNKQALNINLEFAAGTEEYNKTIIAPILPFINNNNSGCYIARFV